MAMNAHKVTGGGGLQLYVEETGNPNGRPILFIHGFSQCRLAWSKQLDSELAQDFRLVAMDIRGHGLSEKPREVYNDSKLWADDVQAVILTLSLDRPVLSGWSYGGVIICDYLRFYGEDHIGGINLVGAVTKLGTDAALAVIGPDLRANVEGLFSIDIEESVRTIQTFLRLCVYEEPSPRDFYFFLGYNMIVPPYVRQGLFSRSLENDDLLPRIRKPVLITHGEKDALVLSTAAQQHAAAIRQARTSFYPNVGHAPFWEDAPRFNRELRAFAESL
jgi:pimeloyl-ACP methyl ester carboxylesterase